MYSSPIDFTALHNTTPTEPMMLGSPAGSPCNPTLYGGSQYLPNFLMGESTVSPTNNARTWSSLPGNSLNSPKSRTAAPSYIVGTPITSSPSKSLFSPVVSVATPQSITSRGYSRTTTADKHGGPPVQGLFDHTSSPAQISLLGGSHSSPSPTKRNTPSLFSTVSNSPVADNKSGSQNVKFPMSPAQIDPFYTQGRNLSSVDDLDESWVTVFGFPPTAASYILQQFHHYGVILEHKLPPNGNWMYIRYQSKLQAKIALSKNGKIFGNNYMVGVAPCIDKNMINSPKAQLNAKDSTKVEQNFVHQIVNQPPISPFTSKDFAVITPGTLPQKRSGLVSKAMEYVFGW